MTNLDKVKEKYGKASSDYFTDAVRSQIITFCEQNEEFCQCVAESDSKNLSDCIKYIKDHQKNKSCISDVEAYQLMAEYFFTGAKVECKMSIYLCEAEKETEGKVINLDFSSLI